MNANVQQGFSSHTRTATTAAEAWQSVEAAFSPGLFRATAAAVRFHKAVRRGHWPRYARAVRPHRGEVLIHARTPDGAVVPVVCQVTVGFGCGGAKASIARALMVEEKRLRLREGALVPIPLETHE